VHARFAFFGAVLLAAALVACGGGGGSTPPTTRPTATPCATPAGGGVGFCGTTATATVPPVSGASFSATMNFSAGSGTATITASASAPSGIATLNVAHMRSAAAGAKMHAADSAPYNTIVYVTLTATSAVSLSSTPTFTIASPSGAAGAYYNAQGFWVTLPQSGTFTLANGSAAYFAIYTGGTLPSPNPAGCVGVQADATTRTGAHTQLVGVQPIDQGATFNYTGTLSETISRASPCAMPTATQKADVVVAVSVTSSPYASDEHSVETDEYTTETTATTTDASVAAATLGSASGFSESAETSTDEVGDKTVTAYASPLVYAIASPLPYSGTISNGPPSTVQGYLADGTTTNRTYSADGSYTEADSIAGGGENTITVNSNFSGNYSIDSASYGQIVFTVSAPVSGAITITQSGTGGGTLSVPQWWTGSHLYSDTTVDEGVGGLPSPCNPNPAVSSANDFRRTISIVDPVLGYTETETIDAYVVGGSTAVGPACVVIADTQKLYYDYFFDTTFYFYPSLTASPLQTDTISEAYWYSGAPAGASSVRTQSESPNAIPGLDASIAAHASGIAFIRATQRAQRIENTDRGIETAHVGGVK